MDYYKLVKTYPGSPDMGTRARKIDSVNYIVAGHSALKYLHEFPEFWEKIVEPLLITKDGVKILDKNVQVWGIYADFSDIFTAPVELGLSESWIHGVYSDFASAEKELIKSRLSLSLYDLEIIGVDPILLKEAESLVAKKKFK